MFENIHPLASTLAAVCALSCLPAQAQTTGVTVFGVADSALRHVGNEGRGGMNSIVSGSNATSRLGFRGVEDLGGGLWAGFHLEHGIALDIGSPASSQLFFDRRSTVSVGSKAFGEIRIGRDFVPTYNNWSRYDPFAYVGVAGSNNLISATPVGPIKSAFGSALNTTVRSSNAVQWLLPAGWGGIEGELMWAAREGGTAANGQDALRGLRIGYRDKRFGLAVASARTSNDLTTSGKFQDDSVGGSVNLGAVRMSAAWRRFGQNAARQTHVLVGAWVPVGVGEIRLSYNRVDLSGKVGAVAIDGNDATQIGLGYVHNLSARSALYGTFSKIDNRGAATFAVPGGQAVVAGKASTGIEFGVRHNF